MSKFNLLGFLVWALVGYYDYWAWSGLLSSGLDKLGSLIGFGILALLSFPITIVGFIIGLVILVAD